MGVVPAAVPTFNLAPTLIRAPAHDSASIESHRLGGNFAYAVAESHAYAQVTPQVSTLTHPVAETTYVHEPATIAKVVPGAVTTVNHIPHPIVETQPILAQEPLVQAKTTHIQPLHKVQTLTHHVASPVTHHQTHHVAPVVQHAYAAVAAPAPVAVEAAHAVPAYAHHGYAAHPAHFAPHGLGYAGGYHAGFPYGLPHGLAHKVISPVAAEE